MAQPLPVRHDQQVVPDYEPGARPRGSRWDWRKGLDPCVLQVSRWQGEAVSARCFGSLLEVWQASHVVREKTERLRLPRVVGESHAAAHPVEIAEVVDCAPRTELAVILTP